MYLQAHRVVAMLLPVKGRHVEAGVFSLQGGVLRFQGAILLIEFVSTDPGRHF
jgi:hypothetical protein